MSSWFDDTLWSLQGTPYALGPSPEAPQQAQVPAGMVQPSRMEALEQPYQFPAQQAPLQQVQPTRMPQPMQPQQAPLQNIGGLPQRALPQPVQNPYGLQMSQAPLATATSPVQNTLSAGLPWQTNPSQWPGMTPPVQAQPAPAPAPLPMPTQVSGSSSSSSPPTTPAVGPNGFSTAPSVSVTNPAAVARASIAALAQPSPVTFANLAGTVARNVSLGPSPESNVQGMMDSSRAEAQANMSDAAVAARDAAAIDAVNEAIANDASLSGSSGTSPAGDTNSEGSVSDTTSDTDSDASGVGSGAAKDGGFVRGKGGPRSDSIHNIALSNGEFIVPAHIVKALGPKFFEDLLKKHPYKGKK